jgi:hypothetical protein
LIGSSLSVHLPFLFIKYLLHLPNVLGAGDWVYQLAYSFSNQRLMPSGGGVCSTLTEDSMPSGVKEWITSAGRGCDKLLRTMGEREGSAPLDGRSDSGRVRIPEAEEVRTGAPPGARPSTINILMSGRPTI